VSDPADSPPESEIVLYRCPTRSNVLCPCGAVVRKLNRLELPYRVERLPYRRKGRAEVIELTGQNRLPMLIDGDEVVSDSKRIIQYLDWRYRADADEADRADSAREPAAES
jgi:glutathione S-transferase